MKNDKLQKWFNKLNSLDINKLKNFIQCLWHEREKLYNILDLLHEGIIIVSDNWIVTYSNRAATEIFGIHNDNFPQDLKQYAPDLLSIKQILKNPNSNNTFTIKELEIFYPHKKVLTLFGICIETDNNNCVYAIVVVDISTTRDMIDKQIANERFSTITLLAGGVAHEIGNPLNAISLRLQLMQKQLEHKRLSNINDQIIQSIVVCREEISRLDGIIKNFLQAIRPQKPIMKPCDINLILDQVLSVLAPEIHNLHIKIIRTNIPLPLILGDDKQLGEAIFNIIKNSIEATDPHGEIRIICSYTELQVILEISDNGHGISAENLQKISEPYFSTKQTGNGLGMMIVERILQEHRATLTIQSIVERGTKVTIIFPLKDPSLPLFN